jgi:hypothetical protein
MLWFRREQKEKKAAEEQYKKRVETFKADLERALNTRDVTKLPPWEEFTMCGEWSDVAKTMGLLYELHIDSHIKAIEMHQKMLELHDKLTTPKPETKVVNIDVADMPPAKAEKIIKKISKKISKPMTPEPMEEPRSMPVVDVVKPQDLKAVSKKRTPKK